MIKYDANLHLLY